MSGHDDPVDAVVLAFLDHLDDPTAVPRPTLHHLGDADRARAELLLAGLTAARGIDPRATRPSVEALLADTPLAALFPGRGAPDLAALHQLLASVDGRAQVRVDADTATVVYSYLDLRARFLLLPTSVPVLTTQVRSRIGALFGADPDTSRVGVVAARGDELLTLVLSPEDVGATISTEPRPHRDPSLPLVLAVRRMLEQGAPEWPAFDFDRAHGDALDLATVAAGIARRVIERESARSYRGDKRRAYQALLGQEQAFVDLVVRVSAPATTVDLDLETTRIVQAAA